MSNKNIANAMVAATKAEGNSVTYDLHSVAGNRVGEDANDLMGILL